VPASVAPNPHIALPATHADARHVFSLVQRCMAAKPVSSLVDDNEPVAVADRSHVDVLTEAPFAGDFASPAALLASVPEAARAPVSRVPDTFRKTAPYLHRQSLGLAAAAAGASAGQVMAGASRGVSPAVARIGYQTAAAAAALVATSPGSHPALPRFGSAGSGLVSAGPGSAAGVKMQAYPQMGNGVGDGSNGAAPEVDGVAAAPAKRIRRKPVAADDDVSPSNEDAPVVWLCCCVVPRVCSSY
jgi:hypothetical protein